MDNISVKLTVEYLGKYHEGKLWINGKREGLWVCSTLQDIRERVAWALVRNYSHY